MLVCNITSGNMFFFLQWRTLANVTRFPYDALPINNDHVDGFLITARAVTPAYTIHSTATLMGTLLSHNNMAIECSLLGAIPANWTLTIAGNIIILESDQNNDRVIWVFCRCRQLSIGSQNN